MTINTEFLEERWANLLEGVDPDGNTLTGMNPVKDAEQRAVLAQLLENQAQYIKRENSNPRSSLFNVHLREEALNEDSTTTSSGNMDKWDPILISMVRRMHTSNLGFQIAALQPLTNETGIIFYERPQYVDETNPADRTEALFNKPNNAWSGAGTASGDFSQEIGDVVDSDELVIGARYEILTVGGADYTGGVGAPNNNVGTEFVAGATTAGAGGTVLTLVSASASTGRGMSTAAGEDLVPNEMSLVVDKFNVTAKSRKLAASFTPELLEDYRNQHGTSAKQMLSNIMTKQITQDINREILDTVKSKAKLGARNTTNPGIFDFLEDADGQWLAEKVEAFIYQLEIEKNAISIETRRVGQGNYFVIASPNVASVLHRGKVLQRYVNDLNVEPTGESTFAGTLTNGMRVYVDPFATGEYAVVGYKGDNAEDAGLYYCPYIGLEMKETTVSATGSDRIIFRTRYAMAANPFAAGVDTSNPLGRDRGNPFFRILRVRNINVKNT